LGEAVAALARQSRYRQVADNLPAREVRISDAERFVICYSPQQADRDAVVRERLLAQFEETIAGTDWPPVTKRAKLRGVISTKPGLVRYLRVMPGRLLASASGRSRLRQAWTKHVLRSCDPTRRRGRRDWLQATAAGRTRLARELQCPAS
jgi:hypothetical protein